ncbi:Hypothetical Protein FCC1311_059662 [Hondaea fermentalgiana]|uniref:Acyltransferase 3 domain-containing protein n=1 Tax=Hondaea fermentalgiana TaxID=2315210 RepID=A0A2R5GGL9_9STRA|nr:Hypothetical Protein FCC1311_059662 [Hondaea fermentalgiana]|eukprot:GBG29745.1 Hypothetical Protein FCC1311_059662 [Hondaea fermentalgiana]
MLRTISGIRAFATLWIVLGHFQDTNFRFNHDTTFLLVLSRGFVAVGVYIVLSGFMTHYAYQARRYDTWRAWCAFYLRRVGRVLFTYEVSCLLGLCDPLFTRHDALITKHPLQVVSVCLLVQSWFEIPSQEGFSRDFPNSPNAGGWTISTLLFAWLLYPLMNAFMRRFNQATGNALGAKLGLAALMYALGMLPCILMYVTQAGVISNQQFELLYKFPILRLPDFVIGVILAELVNDPRVASKQRLWRYLPDTLTLGFALFVCLCPLESSPLTGLPEGVEQPLIRENAEAFLISGLSPIMAAMLLGYGINSGRTDLGFSFSGLLEYRAVEIIGGFSFAVYCFQFTIFFMIEQWQYNQTGIDSIAIIPHLGAVAVPARLVAGYLLPYLLILFLFAGAWTLWAEQPVAARLAAFSKRHFEGPIIARQPSTSMQDRVAPSRMGVASLDLVVPPKAAVESYRARRSLTAQAPALNSVPSARYFVSSHVEAQIEAEDIEDAQRVPFEGEEHDSLEDVDSEEDDDADDEDEDEDEDEDDEDGENDIDDFMSFGTSRVGSDAGLASERTLTSAAFRSDGEDDEDDSASIEGMGGSRNADLDAGRTSGAKMGWAFSTCA